MTSNFALVRTGQLDIVDGNDVVLVSIGGRPGAHITFNDDEGQVQLDAETLRKLIKEPGPNATP